MGCQERARDRQRMASSPVRLGHTTVACSGRIVLFAQQLVTGNIQQVSRRMCSLPSWTPNPLGVVLSMPYRGISSVFQCRGLFLELV